MNRINLAAAFATIALAVPAASLAQTMTITPTKGQSAAQVETDKAECTTIAQQSAASSVPASTEPDRGGRARGAAAGAAVGAAASNRSGGEAYDRAPDAVQDEYRQEQAKKGAAAGVVVGGVSQRRDNRQDSAQQQQAGAQATDSAYRSCLTSRGYTVQ